MRVEWIIVFLAVAIACAVAEKKTDDYVLTTQNDCYASKKFFTCLKYRTVRYVWAIATGRMNLFDPDTKLEGENRFRLVQLSDPEKEELFSEPRQLSTDTEVTRAMKFVKRSINTFLSFHGVGMGIDNDRGARLIEGGDGDNNSEGRRIRRKKLNLIFPLAILLKLAHLKVMLLPILLGIGAIQLLLIAGGALLFHFLRNNTLCKVQPHLIHSHSHVTDSSPGVFDRSGMESPYSSNQQDPRNLTNAYDISYNSYQGYNPYGPPYGGHISYNKDWATNRAYSAYNIVPDVEKQ
ncbi:hypothetical protein DMENIID0001_018710 [Sergentomyia squamirostris]